MVCVKAFAVAVNAPLPGLFQPSAIFSYASARRAANITVGRMSKSNAQPIASSGAQARLRAIRSVVAC
jgi:hypothetical protein